MRPNPIDQDEIKNFWSWDQPRPKFWPPDWSRDQGFGLEIEHQNFVLETEIKTKTKPSRLRLKFWFEDHSGLETSASQILLEYFTNCGIMWVNKTFEAHMKLPVCFVFWWDTDRGCWLSIVISCYSTIRMQPVVVTQHLFTIAVNYLVGSFWR